MNLINIYVVRAKRDFHIDIEELTRVYKNEDLANQYMNSILDMEHKVPTISFVEKRLGIEDKTLGVYLLEHEIVNIDKDVFIDFAYYRPAK
jgi:hypothetical protein